MVVSVATSRLYSSEALGFPGMTVPFWMSALWSIKSVSLKEPAGPWQMKAALFKDSIGILGYLLLGVYVLRTNNEHQ